MTEAHDPKDIDGPHEGPIKTPKQLILAVLYAFVVPIFGIVLLVMFVTTDKRPAAGSDALGAAAVSARIRPVGVVEIRDSNDAASMKTGDQVFAAQCTACHTAGLLGSPKFGDADAWAPRIKTGYEALLHSALAGKGQMPPQGGGDFSDFEIGRAVVYMANKAGAKFAEPSAPAASAVVVGASAPMADANAGTPVAPQVAGLNGQVQNAVPHAVPDSAPAVQVAAATATTTPVVTAAVPAAAGAAPALYTQGCSVCHAAGIAGAPKFGDKAAWAPRIAQGIDALTASAIKGKGAMPPRGGTTASDAEIKTVVTYMVSAAK
ncbi:MAG: c-type cytochrome [Caldimonas sp.]